MNTSTHCSLQNESPDIAAVAAEGAKRSVPELDRGVPPGYPAPPRYGRLQTFLMMLGVLAIGMTPPFWPVWRFVALALDGPKPVAAISTAPLSTAAIPAASGMPETARQRDTHGDRLQPPSDRRLGAVAPATGAPLETEIDLPHYRSLTRGL